MNSSGYYQHQVILEGQHHHYHHHRHGQSSGLSGSTSKTGSYGKAGNINGNHHQPIDDGIVYMNEPKSSSHLNPYQYSVEERRGVPSSRSMPHIMPLLQKDGQPMPPMSAIARSSTRIDVQHENEDVTDALVPARYMDEEEDDDEDTIKDYDEDNFTIKKKILAPRPVTTTIL